MVATRGPALQKLSTKFYMAGGGRCRRSDCSIGNSSRRVNNRGDIATALAQALDSTSRTSGGFIIEALDFSGSVFALAIGYNTYPKYGSYT